MACTVTNLVTREERIYTCSPKEAVIAAYAQSLSDYNTWNYDGKYNGLVEESDIGYLCGNFYAYKEKA